MKHITDYLEKDEVEKLLECAKTYSFRDYLMLRLLWTTGIRVNELLNIRPQDVELRNQVINIVKAKGGKQRRVLSDEETLSMLSKYVLDTKTPDERPIFTFSSVWIWRLVKKYARMAGLSDTIHPHTLRHSFAIHLVRSGLDLRRVQQLLGHSNLNTTQVYLQFKDEDLREGYNAIQF